MSNKNAFAILAAVVFVLGIILAVVPTHITADGDSLSCGTAVHAQTRDAELAGFSSDIADAYAGGPGEGTDFVSQCEDRVGTQRMIAFPIAGVGALGVLFVVLTAGQRADKRTSSQATVSQDEQPSTN